jgi:hypothetical protein
LSVSNSPSGSLGHQRRDHFEVAPLVRNQVVGIELALWLGQPFDFGRKGRPASRLHAVDRPGQERQGVDHNRGSSSDRVHVASMGKGAEPIKHRGRSL